MTTRGTVSLKHQANINRAKAAKTRANKAFDDAIRAAKNDPDEPASIRELARFAGISPNTVRAILDDKPRITE